MKKQKKIHNKLIGIKEVLDNLDPNSDDEIALLKAMVKSAIRQAKPKKKR